MCFLCYYYQDQAALPLFVLYRAILLQTEKGPVDIVNGKAYYSLNEHYILALDDFKYTTMVSSVIVLTVCFCTFYKLMYILSYFNELFW